ncbi:hypothetical protein N7530_010288 [Penicillium desertorum]|uniref:Uncharacterized protein n=1 Tax=Penicillium desertorum TaxID=1303715 RepID=A0A9W9WK84_9EURO|nr:hypothetical protein N7530_010288 [Penicillium desertorum]
MEEQTWKDGATYMTTLRNVVMEYAGCNDKLTTVILHGMPDQLHACLHGDQGDRALWQPQDLEVCLPSRRRSVHLHQMLHVRGGGSEEGHG